MVMRKKSIIMLVCALVIISSVAFGTIAYLTDRASVVNRFTIGNVDIAVDETEVDEKGDPKDNPDYDPNDPNSDPYERTEEGNDYPLVPGGEYVKDPTMTVKAGSEEAYVRMMVTLNNAREIEAIFQQLKAQYPAKYPNGFVPGDFVTGADKTKWVFEAAKTDALNNTYTLEYRYFQPVQPDAAADTVLPPLFEKIKFPGELTNAQLATLKDFSINVVGHAIQTTGFADAKEAWAAFDAQAAVADTASVPAVQPDTAEGDAPAVVDVPVTLPGMGEKPVVIN